jgi:hypothetical protein
LLCSLMAKVERRDCLIIRERSHSGLLQVVKLTQKHHFRHLECH